jgi:hypothetical protein
MSFGISPYTSPALGLGGLMSFMSGANMASFIGSYTWVNRPTSASVGDILNVTDIGSTPGSYFLWNGARWVTNDEQFLLNTWVAFAGHTGTTSKTVIASTTIPGGLLGANGSLSVEMVSTQSAANSLVLWNTTLGGVNLSQNGGISLSYFGHRVLIRNRNSEAVQLGNSITTSDYVVNTNLGFYTNTVNTAVDQTLTLSATLTVAGDTTTLEGWRVAFSSRA